MRQFFLICLLGSISLSSAALENGFDIAVSYDAMSKVVLVSWKNNEDSARQFILQKSDDQQSWINVDTLYNTADFSQQLILWEDRDPVPGGYLYRLMVIVDDLNYSYSKPVYIKINPSVYEWDIYLKKNIDKLTIQYTGKAIISGVINVLLQTRSGRILYRSRSSSSTTLIDIPIANLGKGNYYINMFVEGELIWHYRLKR